MPNAVNANTLERLSVLVSSHRPRRLLVLGDLFHSEENKEWLEFQAWLEALNAEHWFEEFRLVEGNHDILHPSAFKGCGWSAVRNGRSEPGFSLTTPPIW